MNEKLKTILQKLEESLNTASDRSMLAVCTTKNPDLQSEIEDLNTQVTRALLKVGALLKKC